jgi:hypothetical protein
MRLRHSILDDQVKIAAGGKSGLPYTVGNTRIALNPPHGDSSNLKLP